MSVDRPLTRDFRKTVTADLRSREFRAMYLAETIAALHDGEFAVGKRMLRNYIDATTGFDALGDALGAPAVSLTRMLGSKGNLRAGELFVILKHLREADRFDVRVVPGATRKSRPR